MPKRHASGEGMHEFRPVASDDRIQALDVVRGVALLGIALMNVEFFNRPIGDLDAGLPLGATGLDYWAGWLNAGLRPRQVLDDVLAAVRDGLRGDAGARDGGRPRLPLALPAAHAGAGRVRRPAFHRGVDRRHPLQLRHRRPAAGDRFAAKPQVLLWLGVVLLPLAAAFGMAGAAGHPLPWQPMLGIGIPLLLLGAVAYALRRWPVSGWRAAGLALYLLPALAMTLGSAAMLGRPPEAEQDRVRLAEARTRSSARRSRPASRSAQRNAPTCRTSPTRPG